MVTCFQRQEESELEKIREWVQRSETGDKADMGFQVGYDVWKQYNLMLLIVTVKPVHIKKVLLRKS